MKKLFTLGLSLVLALSSQAKDEVRKLWDFTQGFSETTIANLTADAESGSGYWTNKETWFETKARTAGPLTCKVNGEEWVIPETEGLTIGASSAKHFNIVISHNDGPHIWLNGRKSEDYIIIPQVPAGDSITVVYASHSGTEERGFKSATDGVVGKYDGATQWKTVGKKDTVVLINNNAEDTDVKLQATNGMHFFYICVGEKPSSEPKVTHIAYIYDSGYPGYTFGSDDMNYDVISNTLPMRLGEENMELKAIDVADGGAAISADSLQYYDAVVVSNAIRKDNAFVGTLKSAIAYVPMLNLSPDLYETWGYGKSVATTTNMLDVTAIGKESPVFQPSDQSQEPYIDENGQLMLYEEGNITGYEVEPGSYFANDDTLAMAGTAAAVHIHNANRNAYMMIPYAFPMGSPAGSFMDISPNAIIMLCDTKAKVTNAANPTISQEYHHLYTTVSLSCVTKNYKVYYTTDGSTPTTESTLYTEPFDIKAEGVTVKAIATADGYLTSGVAEKTIDIYELADKPTITVTEESGKSTITITPAHEGDVVFYNFSGSDEKAKSAEYTEPITVNKHTTVTAFTDGVEGSYLQSELTQKFVAVQDEKVRMDIVSHMDANATDYNVQLDGSYYTKGYNFYTDEIIDKEIYEDYFGPGQDSIVNIYAPANKLTCVNPGKGWEIKSYGQPMLYQNNDAGHNVLDFNAYNPQTPWDDSEQEITKGCVAFQSVTGTDGNGFKDPASACIQSTEAFQGPFDVVTYMSGKNAKVEVLVTNDTISGEWTKIGDLVANTLSGNGDNGKPGDDRIWKKTILSYEGTDMVYVKLASGGTKANIFDIFIKNEGEASKDYITGIKDVTEGSEAAGEVVKTIVYSINGTQLNEPAKGINIIKEVYANGQVKTKKVMVK